MLNLECLFKAMAIILLTLVITGCFLLRFKDCQGDYCPSVTHAKMKWKEFTNGK